MTKWDYKIYVSENIKDLNDTSPQVCYDLAEAIKPQISNVLLSLHLKGMDEHKSYKALEDCYLDFCFISDYCLIEAPQEYGVDEWWHLFNFLFLKFKKVCDMKIDKLGRERLIWLI